MLSTTHHLGIRARPLLMRSMPSVTLIKTSVIEAQRSFAVRVRPPRHPKSDPAPPPSHESPFMPPPAQPTLEETVPVRIPLRKSTDVIQNGSTAVNVLAHPSLMIGRQLEMMNVLIGYEQANKYAIKSASGQDVGFIAEEDHSFLASLVRQFLHTRRSFNADILDSSGNIVLKIKRPLKLFLNSHIEIYTPQGELIGEVRSNWHLWRRRYDLFMHQKQIAVIDEGLWAWDFHVKDEKEQIVSVINRNFGGFAREIFTDTGTYALHMDSIMNAPRPLSLDERAVLLACAINIDIDYFSRHSGGGGFLPIPFLFGGGGYDSDLVDRSTLPQDIAMQQGVQQGEQDSQSSLEEKEDDEDGFEQDDDDVDFDF